MANDDTSHCCSCALAYTLAENTTQHIEVIGAAAVGRGGSQLINKSCHRKLNLNLENKINPHLHTSAIASLVFFLNEKTVYTAHAEAQ